MNDLPISSTILFALAAALVLLAVVIFVKYQRSQSIRFYVGFLLGLAIIAMAQASLGTTEDSSLLLNLTRLGYFGGVITFSMLLMFSLYFPVPTASRMQQPNLAWIIPVVFFAPVVFLTDAFILSVAKNSGGTTEVVGFLYYVFPTFVILYVAWSLKNLLAKRTLTQGSSRPVGMFLWALVIATSLGLFFDVLLPAFGQPRIPVGIYSAIALFGLSTFIVVKK